VVARDEALIGAAADDDDDGVVVDPAAAKAAAAGAAPDIGGISRLWQMSLGGDNRKAKIALLVIVLSLFAFSLFLNYWEIHLYFAYYNQNQLCPHDLGKWLYVSGITGFVGVGLSTVGTTVMSLAKRRGDRSTFKGGAYLHCVNQLNNLFGFIWMIYGSALVYSIDYGPTPCPSAVVNFMWYFITVTWVFAGALIFLTCVVTAVALVVRQVRGRRYEVDQ